MVKIQVIIEEKDSKRQDALANSRYSIVQKMRETKTSLENSKKELLTKKHI